MMRVKQALILAFLLGATGSKAWHPTCNIVEYKADKDSGSRHAIHKCKTKSGDFKCSDMVLDDCVAVNNKTGRLFVRGSGSTPAAYKTLAANCPDCTYYGYPMVLHCLCGPGDRPTLFEPTSLHLKDILVNNNGILGNNDDSTGNCVAKEVKCP